MVEEVSDVNTAKRIHLGEREHAGIAKEYQRLVSEVVANDKPKVLGGLIMGVPAYIQNLFKLFNRVDCHWHIIVRRDDLATVRESVELGRHRLTPWKSSLYRILSNSAYLSNNLSKKLSKLATE